MEIEYNDYHYQNLVTYKMFTQHVRPIVQKENPKAPSSKIMMLVAAKWREFCEENPNLNDEGEEEQGDEKSEEASEEEQDDFQTKRQSGRGARKTQKPAKQQDAASDDEDDVSDEDSKKSSKKRSSARASKRGGNKGKQKVPTLKIRFGKKKNASSDEEKVRSDFCIN